MCNILFQIRYISPISPFVYRFGTAISNWGCTYHTLTVTNDYIQHVYFLPKNRDNKSDFSKIAIYKHYLNMASQLLVYYWKFYKYGSIQ